MKVKPHADGHAERQILIGMITDTAVVGRVAARWNRQDGMFRSRWADMIGMWCCKYYSQYQTAPGANIESIFRRWSSNGRDEGLVKLIDQFLSGLSEEYEQKPVSTDYVIDLAGKHFQTVALERLAAEITDDIERNDPDKALSRVTGYNRIGLDAAAGINVLEDHEAMLSVFSEQGEALIEWPGDLAKFYGSSFERDSFIAYFAPEKRGKCLEGSMLVLCADGSLRTIEDLVRNEADIDVLAMDEKSQRIIPVQISEWHDNGEKDCWEITTRTGRRIVSTNNHQYLTQDGWKCLSNLSIDDFVAVPKLLDVFGMRPMDEDELKFLAYMLADGCCAHGQTLFVKTDEVLVQDFLSSCEKLGIQWSRRDITYRLRNAIPLTKRLGLMGCLSKTKIIPDCVFCCPKEQVSLFLRILFSCDGYVNKDGTVGITLANEGMITQIRHLLTRFGIVAAIRYGDTYNDDGKRFEFWTLDIRDSENVSRFLSCVNMMSYKYREPKDIQPRKSFLDKFPYQVARSFVSDLVEEFSSAPIVLEPGKRKRVWPNHALRKRVGTEQLAFIREQIAKKQPIMRISFASANGTQSYDKYMNSHILWDQVMSVRFVGRKRTYDLTIPDHHNFIANDYIVHNSMFLLDVAWRAMVQKRRTAFFAIGDMSERQVMRRLLVRAAGKPFTPRVVKKPVSIKREESGEIKVEYDEVSFDEPLSWHQAVKACEKITRGRTIPYLKLSCHPNSAIGMDGVRGILADWAREGWVADVVVIDYADNLDPPPGSGDPRNAVNMIWKQMRRASQELHCCLVTASQTDAESYAAQTITKKNFSENKLKNAHTTGVVGINQTDDEKKQGIYRLNWVVRREEEFSEYRCAAVAGCLALVRPVMVSVF